MPAFRNVTKKPLRFNLDGNDPKGVQTVEPGEVFTLGERHAYLIGTQINPAQVEELDLAALAAKQEAKTAKATTGGKTKAAEQQPGGGKGADPNQGTGTQTPDGNPDGNQGTGGAPNPPAA